MISTLIKLIDPEDTLFINVGLLNGLARNGWIIIEKLERI